MSTPYDELRVALEAFNEQADPAIGESMVHVAVRKIVRASHASIWRVSDFEDICQEVELAIALAMRERRRKVGDVIRTVSKIVERKIIDANGRSKIGQNTVLIEPERWERIESKECDEHDDFNELHVKILIGELPGLTERDKLALVEMCDGNDTEGIRQALERHTGSPVKENAAKQAAFRAR